MPSFLSLVIRALLKTQFIFRYWAKLCCILVVVVVHMIQIAVAIAIHYPYDPLAKKYLVYLLLIEKLKFFKSARDCSIVFGFTISAYTFHLSHLKTNSACPLLRAWWLLTYLVFVIRFQFEVASQEIQRSLISILLCLWPSVISLTVLVVSSFWFNHTVPFGKFRESGEKQEGMCSETIYSPEERCAPLGKALFLWIQPLVSKARNQPLVKEDLFGLNSSDDLTTFCAKFQKTWVQGKTYWNLLSALLFSCWEPLVVAAFLRVLGDLCAIGNPLILQRLISFMENSSESVGFGIMYGVILLVLSLATAFILVVFFFDISFTCLSNGTSSFCLDVGCGLEQRFQVLDSFLLLIFVKRLCTVSP